MMSFLLLIIAGVVIYYLYNTFEEYLKNPHNPPTKQKEKQEYEPPKDNPYSLPTPKDKLANSYAGASIGMLNALLQAGINPSAKSPSLLQTILIHNFIKQLNLQDSQENMLRNMLKGVDFSTLESSTKSTANTAQDSLDSNLDSSKAQNSSVTIVTSDSKEGDYFIQIDSPQDEKPISDLAQVFLDNTYGEYKKRLHFVGFALMLAWSDKELNEKEQDVILDIAAFLQLENAEFNELYESFESRFGKKDKANELKELNESNKADKSQAQSDKANIDSKKLLDTYTKDLENEARQSEISLQDAYQNIAQKLYAKSQKNGEPQVELLEKLIALDSAYNAKHSKI
ncbi:hypothetical protein [Helicobacter sp. T3_23-1056]